MYREPCICGAPDCRECYPQNFMPVTCECCGEESEGIVAEMDGWQEIEGKMLCPSCQSNEDEEE